MEWSAGHKGATSSRVTGILRVVKIAPSSVKSSCAKLPQEKMGHRGFMLILGRPSIVTLLNLNRRVEGFFYFFFFLDMPNLW